jgi:hypothetical protein
MSLGMDRERKLLSARRECAALRLTRSSLGLGKP